jgi:hypothetical protein
MLFNEVSEIVFKASLALALENATMQQGSSDQESTENSTVFCS